MSFFGRLASCDLAHVELSLPAHREAGWGSIRFEDPHHEATRGVGPVTGAAGSEGRFDRPDVTQPVEPKGPWCSYHRGPFTYFRQTTPMRQVPVGPRAVLVEVDDAAAALALATWARSRVDADEIVPAAATVLFDGVTDLSVLAGWSPTADVPAGDLVEVPVVYDGPDLAFVADLWGTDTAGVVQRHTAGEYVAEFCGFAPGFSYLAGLPAELAVPRLESPRAAVPPGSVGLAGTWCGVYPTASPGGWRLLGRTDAVLWDQARPAPALLPPGSRVRFVPS